jgi:hypothetical protein
MPSNVKYAIRDAQIEDLDGAIRKEIEMEEIMIETNVNPEIILGKVQREMGNLTIENKGSSSSKNLEKRGIGGGIFQGVILDVRNDLATTQETKKIIEITEMNRTIQQMQNELIRAKSKNK